MLVAIVLFSALFSSSIAPGARASHAPPAPGSRASRGMTCGFLPFFAGGAGPSGACSRFSDTLPGQIGDSGRQVFVSRCAGCHGSDGNGGELGPAIAARVATRSDQDLATVVRDGVPAAGMPAFGGLGTAESADLVRYLRTLRPRNGSSPSS